MRPFEDRANDCLSGIFQGLHHVGKIRKEREGQADEAWSVQVVQDVSTFDFDLMTRIVFLAHWHCLRASLSNGGPRALKLTLWNRQRTGIMWERHPGLSEAILDASYLKQQEDREMQRGVTDA